jgi:hypothetical protein
MPIRVSEDQEIVGLDLSQHGESIQTSIFPQADILERKIQEILTESN